MRIEGIADHPELIETVAQWQWESWGNLEPGDSLAKRIAYLTEQAAHRDRIPTTFVALEEDEPLGSASLVAHDMDTHPELSPWLASVYVKPAARGRGVASALVRRVVQEAARLGYARLYLFTEDAHGLYKKIGWQAIATEQFQGLGVTIMAIETI